MSTPRKLPRRELREEDFTLGNWWRTKFAEADSYLSAITTYEYARESRVLRKWAKIEALDRSRRKTKPKSDDTHGVEGVMFSKHDKAATGDHNAMTKKLEVAWPDLYPVLWALRAELAKDVPWLGIEEQRRTAALAAGEFSAPSYFAPWPGLLRPAFEAELQGPGPVTFEDWTFDRKTDMEIVAFRVDWKKATNAELADALAFWRPDEFPEPKREKKQLRGRKTRDRYGGGLKSSDYRAALKHLTVLRLAHLHPESKARDLAEQKLGIPRERISDYKKSIRKAVTMFQESIGWLDKDGPLSGDRFPIHR